MCDKEFAVARNLTQSARLTVQPAPGTINDTMDLYSFSLTLGAAGLFVMAIMGLSSAHSGGHGHSDAGHGHAGHGHAGHGHSGHGHAGHGHGHHGHDGHGHSHGAPQGRGSAGHPGHDDQGEHGNALLALLSPRVLFSFLLGLGTVGVAMRSFAGEPILFVSALAGGVAFERLLVNPLWNFMFRFASSPALTLESAIEDDAKAVTNFDQNGQGLIAVEVDGHVVQVLGTLTHTDRNAGVRVRAGDVVRIEEVDADRNRCTVRKS